MQELEPQIVDGGEIDIDDILGALPTIDSGSGTNVNVAPPGDQDPNTLLAWALNSLGNAERLAEEAQQHFDSAVVHARRALNSLTDWYLARDGFCFCADPPRTADAKANVLMERGIIDSLTNRVLARAITVRDSAEHEFANVEPHGAEDFVELVRRTISSLMAASNPMPTVARVGSLFLGGSEYSHGNHRVLFHGWFDSALVFFPKGETPWMGLVVPNPNDKAVAEVRRCYYRNVRWTKLNELLFETDKLAFRSSSTIGFKAWSEIISHLKLAGH